MRSRSRWALCSRKYENQLVPRLGSPSPASPQPAAGCRCGCCHQRSEWSRRQRSHRPSGSCPGRLAHSEVQGERQIADLARLRSAWMMARSQSSKFQPGRLTTKRPSRVSPTRSASVRCSRESRRRAVQSGGVRRRHSVASSSHGMRPRESPVHWLREDLGGDQVQSSWHAASGPPGAAAPSPPDIRAGRSGHRLPPWQR